MQDPPVAYADESFLEAHDHGYYILAAAVFEPCLHAVVRKAMLELRGKRDVAKLHWNEMERAEQERATARVAELEGLHVVTVGSPVPRRRQERARAACLTRLVVELHGYGVRALAMEARTRELDARDVATVLGRATPFPRGLPFGSPTRRARKNPMFWAADIVAGAVRAERQGRSLCLDLLVDCLYEIRVPTGC